MTPSLQSIIQEEIRSLYREQAKHFSLCSDPEDLCHPSIARSLTASLTRIAEETVRAVMVEEVFHCYGHADNKDCDSFCLRYEANRRWKEFLGK